MLNAAAPVGAATPHSGLWEVQFLQASVQKLQGSLHCKGFACSGSSEEEQAERSDRLSSKTRVTCAARQVAKRVAGSHLPELGALCQEVAGMAVWPSRFPRFFARFGRSGSERVDAYGWAAELITAGKGSAGPTSGSGAKFGPTSTALCKKERGSLLGCCFGSWVGACSGDSVPECSEISQQCLQRRDHSSWGFQFQQKCPRWRGFARGKCLFRDS